MMFSALVKLAAALVAVAALAPAGERTPTLAPELSSGARGPSASTVRPLSQAEGQSLVDRALASPQVQAFMRQLGGRGWPVGEGSLYTVIAGGKKPATWPDLRNFAFFSPLRDGDARILGGGGSPANASSAGSQTGWALTVFGWNLADYPEENVLLRFKLDSELALLAYNLGVRHGVAMGLAAKDSNKPTVYFAGFAEMRYEQVKECYEGALKAARHSDYIEVPFEGVMHVLEDRMGITFEELGHVLLQLAQAEKEGRFAEKYAELSQGHVLQSLVRFMIAPTGSVVRVPEEIFHVPRVQKYIRALAVEFARALPAARLQPQGWPVIVDLVKAKLLDLLLNALTGFFQGEDEPRFVRVFVDPPNVRIGKTVRDLQYHWLMTWGYIDKRMGPYGVPDVGRSVGEMVGLYSALGMRLQWYGSELSLAERSWLALAFAVVYAYDHYAFKMGYPDDLTASSPFAPGFRSMLKVFHVAIERGINRVLRRPGGHDHERGFVPCGVSVKGLTDVQIVMWRSLDRPRPWTGELEPHQDIAVVRYHDRSGPGMPMDFAGVADHIHEAFRCFPKVNHALLPRRHGLNIVAVVLPTLHGTEVDAVRRLADALRREIQYQGTPNVYNDFQVGEAAFLIWREVRDGTPVVVYSCFERRGLPRRGPERLTSEEKEEIVRKLLLDGATLPVHEYSGNNGSSTGSSRAGSSSARSSGSGVVVGIDWWGSGDPHHIIYPMSAPRR